MRFALNSSNAQIFHNRLQQSPYGANAMSLKLYDKTLAVKLKGLWAKCVSIGFHQLLGVFW